MNGIVYGILKARVRFFVPSIISGAVSRCLLLSGVYVDMGGDKFSARIAEVFPPKSVVVSVLNPLKRKRPYAGVASPIHVIGGDMSLTHEESLERDDPTLYHYRVQILEEDKHDAARKRPGGGGSSVAGHGAVVGAPGANASLTDQDVASVDKHTAESRPRRQSPPPHMKGGCGCN